MISIHAARVGCDRITPQGTVFCADFNPRSPSGLRLPRSSIGLKTKLFQSTQPEWAATRRWRTAGIGSRHFNPRSPSGLRPAFGNQRSGDTFKFQSTQPEWAATVLYHNPDFIYNNFNPRSPSGLRPVDLIVGGFFY